MLKRERGCLQCSEGNGNSSSQHTGGSKSQSPSELNGIGNFALATVGEAHRRNEVAFLKSGHGAGSLQGLEPGQGLFHHGIRGSAPHGDLEPVSDSFRKGEGISKQRGCSVAVAHAVAKKPIVHLSCGKPVKCCTSAI